MDKAEHIFNKIAQNAKPQSGSIWDPINLAKSINNTEGYTASNKIDTSNVSSKDLVTIKGTGGVQANRAAVEENEKKIKQNNIASGNKQLDNTVNAWQKSIVR